MERKFESELGKQFAEGKTRRTYRPLGLAIAAVAVMALFTGATAFSFVTMASESPVVDAGVLLSDVEDKILVQEDTAAKRVVNLKYRSVTPPGDGDAGVFRFSYAVNLMIKADGSGISVGDVIGNLVIDFDSDLDDALVTVAVTAEIFDPAGVPALIDAISVADMDGALDVIEVDAEIPVAYDATGALLTLAPGYSVSINISVSIEDAPALTGTVVEQPFPAITTVDELGNAVYAFEDRMSIFPILDADL